MYLAQIGDTLKRSSRNGIEQGTLFMKMYGEKSKSKRNFPVIKVTNCQFEGYYHKNNSCNIMYYASTIFLHDRQHFLHYRFR